MTEPSNPDYEATDEYGDNKVDKPEHALYNDYEAPENDIFAQEFFLHAYAVFNIAKSQFYDSREGHTFIRMDDQKKLSKRIIGTLRGPCGNYEKWDYKME